MHPGFVNVMPDPFVKMFASPYIAGDSIGEAVRTAVELHRERRLASSLDLLGEESKDAAQIESAMATYRSLLDSIASARGLPTGRARPTVSLKPSTFTVAERDAKGELSKATDLARAYDNIAAIAAQAKERSIDLTIDMEDHAWVDFTLDATRRLIEAGLVNVGTVLQSMLFRTRDDVAAIDPRTRIRLVIGIYKEPGSIAYTEKRDMKKKLLEYAETLAMRGVYVEYATHDEEYIHRFLAEVVREQKLPPDRFEVQMLLGVPRGRLQTELATGSYFARAPFRDDGVGKDLRRGVLTRLYVPFALSWGQALAYCRRRLYENPNIMWYGLKNLVIGS